MSKRSLFVAASLLTTASLLGACASSDDQPDFDTPKAPTFKAEAVKVDQHFSNSAIAHEDRLIVPEDAQNQKVLATIRVGSVVVGNRDLHVDINESANPYGFLRRVTAITSDGGKTTLSTVHADIEEWLDEGDLVLNGTQPSLFDDPAALAPRDTLHVLANKGGAKGSGVSSAQGAIEGEEQSEGDGDKKVFVKPVIRISNTRFALNADFDAEFKVRKTFGIPRGIKRAKALFTVDPTVSADLELGVQVGGPGFRQGTLALGTTSNVPIAKLDDSWKAPPIKIAIPAGPVPVTLKFQPVVRCHVSVRGEATMKFRAELKAHGAVGFQYQGGDFTDLSEAPTFDPNFLKLLSVKGEASGTAECSLFIEPSVLAFDAVGVEGGVGPYIQINADACAAYDARQKKTVTAANIYEQHGLGGDFSGRVQIPVIGKGKNFKLISWRGFQSEPKYILGKGDSCDVAAADSCEGRADGFYCSELESYGGIYCVDQQIAGGMQCDSLSKTCVSGTADSIVCQ